VGIWEKGETKRRRRKTSKRRISETTQSCLGCSKLFDSRPLLRRRLHFAPTYIMAREFNSLVCFHFAGRQGKEVAHPGCGRLPWEFRVSSGAACILEGVEGRGALCGLGRPRRGLLPHIRVHWRQCYFRRGGGYGCQSPGGHCLESILPEIILKRTS
jgi:hypothetical protein